MGHVEVELPQNLVAYQPESELVGRMKTNEGGSTNKLLRRFSTATNIDSSPVRVTINCNSEPQEKNSLLGHPLNGRYNTDEFLNNHFDVESFCTLIQNAIPKAVKHGKFVSNEDVMDQYSFGDSQSPVAVAPPKGFISNIPKLRIPKIKVPVMKVPKLKSNQANISPPRIEKFFTTVRETEEETSAEKMEKFKKGIQKMLHVVKVLGQIDQYLSERTRIVIEKLSKTLAD